QDALGADLDIGGLTLGATEGLVNHHFAVGQGEPFSFGSGREQKGTHGSGHSDTDRLDVAFNMLHGIIDGEPCGNGTARRVDVQLNVFIGIFGLQEQQLGDYGVGHRVVKLAAQKDN